MQSTDAPSTAFLYLDSSVAVRLVLAYDAAADRWFDERVTAGQVFVSSRLLELEVTRVLRREALDLSAASVVVDQLTLLGVDDALIAEAAAIRPRINSLDALHLASAQRLGAGSTTVVTHDSSMARVADHLGFEVYDPIA